MCSATLDTLKGELQELEQTVGSFRFIDQCDEIDKAQMLYAYLKKHYFFHFYPHIWFNYETGATHIDNQKYWELLKTIASHTPKTLLQQMIFPYGNAQYAERGEGVYLCKMGAGVWQSGVWQAKGKLVIESEKLIDFPFSDQVCKQSYELSKQTQERIKLFFEIEKSNQELSSLPYVQQKE